MELDIETLDALISLDLTVAQVTYLLFALDETSGMVGDVNVHEELAELYSTLMSSLEPYQVSFDQT